MDHIQVFYHNGCLCELSSSKCFALCMGCGKEFNLFDAEHRKEVHLVPMTKETILVVIEQHGGQIV